MLKVEVWSDIVCPWCYIGLHRFESALAAFAHRDEVAVHHRSFELDHDAPAIGHRTVIEHLAEKYGVSRREAEQLEQRAAEAAAAEGLPFRSDRIRANTFDAHRLLHMAAETGGEPVLLGALFAAHFAERRVLSDHETLVAGALGIHSVPFVVLNRRYAIPGAQPADAILEVLDGAWTLVKEASPED